MTLTKGSASAPIQSPGLVRVDEAVRRVIAARKVTRAAARKAFKVAKVAAPFLAHAPGGSEPADGDRCLYALDKFFKATANANDLWAAGEDLEDEVMIVTTEGLATLADVR